MFSVKLRAKGEITTKGSSNVNNYYPKVVIVDFANSVFEVAYDSTELSAYANGTIICQPLIDKLGVDFKIMYVEYGNEMLVFSVDTFLRGTVLWNSTILTFSSPYTFAGTQV